jgi:hypothetical protein
MAAPHPDPGAVAERIAPDAAERFGADVAEAMQRVLVEDPAPR